MPLVLSPADAETYRLDAYLVWAAHTGFRDYALDEGRRVSLIVECAKSVASFVQAVENLPVVVSPLYHSEADDVVDRGKTHFCTVTISVDDIYCLLPHVTRMELGTAIRTGEESDPREPGIPAVRTRQRAEATGGVVVGVIDDFVAFGNPTFAGTAGSSRVRWVWSQAHTNPRAEPNSLWSAASDCGYGFELSTAGFVGSRKPRLEDLRNAYPSVLPRWAHGTHVADIAAGNERTARGSKICKVDIVAIHLPPRVLADSSGGALSVQALDGLRYILRRAGGQANVVVNLSYSTMAGPHDGTSLLEAAMDELIDLRRGKLAVVIPAGNAYEERCHARVVFDGNRRRATLEWQVAPDDGTPSFMEIWLPEKAVGTIAVLVRGPAGERIRTQTGNFWVCDNEADPVQSTVGIVSLKKVANGNTGTMILVALAPTRPLRPGASAASHGLWRVELSHTGTPLADPIRVWVERDDTAHGRPRAGRQSRLLDAHYPLAGAAPGTPEDSSRSQVKRHGAFNTIATGRNTIVVGGTVNGIGSVAPYSGSGPTRSSERAGPDILAPSEESSILRGLRACGVHGVDTVRMNGTSVAVPQIVRLIAGWYSSSAVRSPRLRPAVIRKKLARLVRYRPRAGPEAAQHQGAGGIPLQPRKFP